jgi:5'-methylthioadenosine phosphorylase
MQIIRFDKGTFFIPFLNNHDYIRPKIEGMKRIGLIGGSGLEKLALFDAKEELEMITPFGKPSSSILRGTYQAVEVFIISRHGRDHSITPGHVNNRGNISALKELGCDAIFATTACGSLREEIMRGDIVFPDQFIDFTKHRVNTFIESFEGTGPIHPAMPDPFSMELRDLLTSAARKEKLRYHPKGTVVTIEGPRFSTRAESGMYRLLGADIINMSTAPEASLANEAGLKYAAIALSTDYDCWKTDEEHVTWDEIFRVFQDNVQKVTNLLMAVIRQMD